jgi:RNA polymerase-interacting CarD/CdnL/TRCF family regulator
MAKYRDPADAILGLTESVTKVWTKQRKAEERDRSARANRNYRMMRSKRVTIREAAFDVMREAYQKASNNGELPVNPRQIYYAARRQILNLTGRDELQSGYFLQTLLRDYMTEYDCDDWDIVWDARGHFTEPHTKKVVPLGTLQVRQYLGERPKLGPAIEVNAEELYPTQGPENRYKSILFIEKEGFDPLIEASHIAERFDVGIMSTKGMSVTAARRLLDRLAERGVEQVLVGHDFDIKGFSIFGTLGTSSKAYWFQNQIPIINIGLRLADIGELLAEPYSSDQDWAKVSRTLKRHGATEAEIAFLEQGERVELNAMTSDEFIDFLEQKFEEHGVEKLVPGDKVIEHHARRMLEQRLIQKELKTLRPAAEKRAAAIKLPDDFRKQVETQLKDNSELPWDAAVAAVVEQLLVEDTGDEEAAP